MNRRRFIWQKAQAQSGLPEGYTALEYIQSSGSQYIDTGYRYGASSDVEIKFDVSTNALLGAQDSDDRKHKFAAAISGGSLWIIRSAAVVFNNISRMTKPLILKNTGALFKLTDSTGIEKTETANDTGYIGSQLSLYLFARHDPTGANNMGKSQIYYCRLYENGELVCDMRPCLDTDGVPCMYDLVRKQTLYNQGTGSFTWG